MFRFEVMLRLISRYLRFHIDNAFFLRFFTMFYMTLMILRCFDCELFFFFLLMIPHLLLHFLRLILRAYFLLLFSLIIHSSILRRAHYFDAIISAFICAQRYAAHRRRYARS